MTRERIGPRRTVTVYRTLRYLDRACVDGVKDTARRALSRVGYECSKAEEMHLREV